MAFLWVTLPAFALGAVLIAFGARRAPAADVRARWLKFSVFFLIVHAVIAASAGGALWMGCLVAFIAVAGARELALATRRLAANRLVIWVVYAAIALLAVTNAATLPGGTVAFLFLVAAGFDGFSQAIGQWIGRTPLAPRISPAKTVEGCIGGFAGALVIAAATSAAVSLPLSTAIAVGFAASAAALAGDLSKSWVKRRAGIKDFARTLPGQGGFLDRFDSFLAATALVGTALHTA